MTWTSTSSHGARRVGVDERVKPERGVDVWAAYPRNQLALSEVSWAGVVGAGMSGAELSNVINQAALKASIEGLKAINMETIEWAKDKILMGSERLSAVISKETATVTAYHEVSRIGGKEAQGGGDSVQAAVACVGHSAVCGASVLMLLCSWCDASPQGGHALVALKTGGADPVYKATIMPRGQALGMVTQLPDGDQTSMSKKQALARCGLPLPTRIILGWVEGRAGPCRRVVWVCHD